MAAERMRADLSKEYNPGENMYGDDEDGLNMSGHNHVRTFIPRLLKSSVEIKMRVRNVKNVPPPLPREEEERRIEEFLKKSDEEWKKQMEPAGGRYVCRRCRERGHFIQYCPTIAQFTWRRPLNT